MQTTNHKLQTINRIYLIGMMGVGKTTKGKKIAQLLGYLFIDLDREIEKHLNKNITQIFEEDGEEFFRKTESEVLQSIKNNHVVIATGGGAPCYFNNMQYIKNNGISIYLKAKPGLIFQRISQKPDKRPLLKGMNESEIKAFIDKKIAERESYYLQSDHIFEIPAISVESIVNSIL
ncbi:MAG: shikimate kinase [Bacteroidota bacterium]